MNTKIMSIEITWVLFTFQIIAQGATASNLWNACVDNQPEHKKVVEESLQPFCMNVNGEYLDFCSAVGKPDACRNEASTPDRQNHDIKIERATNESLIYKQKTRTLCYKSQLKNESKAGVYRGVMADVEIGKYPYEYRASLGCVLKRPVAIEILESLLCCIKFPDNWTIPEKEDHLRVYSHAIPMTPNGHVTDSGYLKLSDLEKSSKSDRQKTREFVLSFFFGARGIVGLVTVAIVAMCLVIFICCIRQNRRNCHGACQRIRIFFDEKFCLTENQSTSKTAGSCKSQAESQV